MTRLLIIGPPGAGKGTQSAKLSEYFDITAIATGDIFRWNIANETELGLQVKALVDGGDFVPDSLTNSLIANRLEEDDVQHGFLLDGYPRTVDQAHFLDQFLANHDDELDAVIQLEADRDEVVERLRKRAVEQGRSDDTEKAIRHRQEVFQVQTAPLIKLYEEKGLLVSVDGLGAIDEVFGRIIEALSSRGIQA